MSSFSPDDPKLTAYALGELEPADRAAVEAALRDDPALHATLAEIRATVAQLESALALEAAQEPADVAPNASTAGRAAIIAGDDPRKLDGGPLHGGAPTLGKLIKFPQFYYVVGGLAAACFAIFVALRPKDELPVKRTYTEVTLVPGADKDEKAAPEFKANVVAQDKALPPAASANSPVTEPPPASEVAAKAAGVIAPLERPAGAAPDLVAEVKAEREARAQERSDLAQNRVVFRAEAQPNRRDRGYLRVNSGTATKIGMEIQKVPSGSFGGFSASARSFGSTAAPSAEAYAYHADNDFLGAGENPLSTFSIDVDTASYANVRRFLQNGRLPPPDAVRVEELVNYFPYQYAPPKDDVPFAASMEVADAPWAPTHRLVRIGLKGREVSTATRPRANLVFLLDVSGSMDEPNKLPLVQESMRMLVGKLRPDDRVAIVTYAGASGLALSSTPVAKAPDIIAAIDELSANGSTNGAMGIQLAYDIAKANFVPGGVNRVILCTDGDFNVGVTNEGDLTRLIMEKAKSGVFLTALGFGMGNYKDAMIEHLADKGNGNYGYIDTRREAEKMLVEQVNGTLVTIAKDVKLQVEFNPAQVASYRLIGYENRLLKKEDFNNDTVDAGEIGAGHTVTALYEVVPVGAEEKSAPGTPAVDPLKYQMAGTENQTAASSEHSHAAFRRRGGEEKNPQSAMANPQSKELLTLKVRYKEPTGDVSRKLEFPLVDSGARFAEASGDFKFAAAVAEFGMILRDSPHKGAGTLLDVLAWADAGTGSDAGGYRGEFADLVRRAETLVR